jgi:2-polyprenyl-6-hydroxyphenyl methylase/3-demethylubiquinone-9 3-methyltransferase
MNMTSQTTVDDPSFINREAAEASGERISFGFGANWRKFVEGLSETTIAHAEKSLIKFSGRESFRHESFLDIGCGSGLSSLAAHRLGADRVLSLDFDPNSVATTRQVRERFAGSPANWEVRQGSVLDAAFMESLGRHSYVYSWGVLHHTGKMWDALAAAARCVAPGGTFHIALYNDNRHSRKWLALKRLYNASPAPVKWLLLQTYNGYAVARILASGRLPWRVAREYTQLRGMDMWRDIEDWLGGLPYEFCKPDQVVEALVGQGFALRKLSTCWSHGCNEFLFTRDLPPTRT